MAKAASERNRPGWDQLSSSWAALMGPIPGWAEQGRGHGHDELAQLRLQLLGVSSGGQGPLGGQGQGPHGGPVLQWIAGGGDQPGTGTELLAPGPPPQTVAQRVGGGDDQGLELAAAVRPAATMPARVVCRIRSASRWPRWRGLVR
jgi:hypothetical protein